jgi:glycosyltransferase involved in cell wall biosynthesis
MRDHISVCICTFRRNALLEHLLKGLKTQETAGLFDFSVVVVDNDAAGCARDTVARLRAELGLDIVYDVEPEQTIPAARNHALRLARGNYIGIIDDDEFPPQTWLVTLFRAIQAFEVDGALGPVHPFFSGQPPAWLVKGRFCERPVHRTGTLLDWSQTRTGNVLLKKDVFDRLGLKFDEKCRTSGSDRVFFKEAIRAGCTFVAVEEAPVYEFVSPERWTKGYYIKRSLLQGFNAHRNIAGERRGASRVIAPIRSVISLAGYAMALPAAACLGAHFLMKCLTGGAYHLSWLASMCGIELIRKRDF